MILLWLKAHWLYEALGIYTVIEWWLGFNKSKTKSASAIALAANLLGVFLRRVPGLGPLLDVIGRAGAAEPALASPPLPTPPAPPREGP